jgi:N-acetyl-anhydromuramyl-L-alanine amidase AmpD
MNSDSIGIELVGLYLGSKTSDKGPFEKLTDVQADSFLWLITKVHDEYNILPCNSTGTMIINGELFSWIIRAGGVGNFESKDKSFVRVCDEKCCEKTKGIC